MAPLTLVSSDEKKFQVESEIIFCSNMIKTMFDDLGHTPGEDEEDIPLPNVTGEVLRKVIDWATHHKDDPPFVEEEESRERRTDDIGTWDLEFLKMEQVQLFDVILAANYMDIKGLLDVTCKTVANMIKGKSPEEIRTMFGIEDDLTEEEKEQIRKENEWCEEK